MKQLGWCLVINIESYKTNLSIQYIDNFLSGGYTLFSLDQSYGTLDLSGSASI